jgi:hypothetical protein
MHPDVTHHQKSTIGRAKIITRAVSLPSDGATPVAARVVADRPFITATPSDGAQEGHTMKRATSPKRSAMPMLHRLIRRLVGFEIDLAGLTVNEHDILNDLNAGRE